MKHPISDPKEASLYTAIYNLSLSSREALASHAADEGCADRLAFWFDEGYTGYMEGMTTLPEDAQLLTLQALDSALNAISGPENFELWTDDAFTNDECWEEIRTLAQKILVEFGW
ncbi:MAG: hypothetical protein ACI9QQ_002305 [Myxococcota bacterium]|jgi:hypothetical protein